MSNCLWNIGMCISLHFNHYPHVLINRISVSEDFWGSHDCNKVCQGVKCFLKSSLFTSIGYYEILRRCWVFQKHWPIDTMVKWPGITFTTHNFWNFVCWPGSFRRNWRWKFFISSVNLTISYLSNSSGDCGLEITLVLWLAYRENTQS